MLTSFEVLVCLSSLGDRFTLPAFEDLSELNPHPLVSHAVAKQVPWEALRLTHPA
jgi:hypothetical protein